jgi:hypothetical protein
MKQHLQSNVRFMSALVMALGLGTVAPASGYDPTQSTGTGTVQEEDGSMSTKRGGNTGQTTGRNEHSGSGTGATRNPAHSEPDQDRSQGSAQMGSDSSHEASQQERSGDESRGQSGVRTNK